MAKKTKQLIDPECGGSGKHTGKEVRQLPSGAGNLILCRACFRKEIAYRKVRNTSLEKANRLSLPTWKSLTVYYRIPRPRHYPMTRAKFILGYCAYVREERPKQFPDFMLTDEVLRASEEGDSRDASALWNKNKDVYRNFSTFPRSTRKSDFKITLKLL